MSAILIIAAILWPNYGLRSQTVVDSVVDELKVLPFTFFKYANTQRTLLFLWSRNCEECRRVFGEHVAPFIDGPKKGQAYVVLVQYETKSARINNIMTLTCSGNKVYAWASLKYLFHGQDEAAARKSEPADVKSSRMQLCRNRTAAREAVDAFLKEIKRQYNPSKLPAIFLDGQRVSDPAELAALTK